MTPMTLIKPPVRKKRRGTTLTASASLRVLQFRQRIREGKALPQTLLRAIQQPSLHYRVAFLLAGLLAIVLTWSLVLSLCAAPAPVSFRCVLSVLHVLSVL